LPNRLGDFTTRLEGVSSAMIGEFENKRLSAKEAGQMKDVRVFKEAPRGSTINSEVVFITDFIYLVSLESTELNIVHFGFPISIRDLYSNLSN
jgi:hypothetical protein